MFSDAIREAGISASDWARWFARMAEAMPGLGGPAAFSSLTLDEMLTVFDELAVISQERVRAMRG